MQVRVLGGRLIAATAAAACVLLGLGSAPAGADGYVPGDIYADVSSRVVTMHAWPAGATLTAIIAGQALMRDVPASGDVSWPDVDVGAGDHITVEVTAGPAGTIGLHREMWVGPLRVTSVDYTSDVVRGVAYRTTDPGLQPDYGEYVQLCVADWALGGEGTCRWVRTAQTVGEVGLFGMETSTWVADFGSPAVDRAGNPLPAFDLKPYWQGMQAGQAAVPLPEPGEPVNMTQHSPAGYPYLDVQHRLDWDPPQSGKAVAYSYDLGSPVEFTLAKSGEVTCHQSVTVLPPGEDVEGWYHWLPYANLDVWADGDACNPHEGDVLTATGSYLGEELTKSLTIAVPRTASGAPGIDADVGNDLVSGQTPAGHDVEVTPWDSSDSVQIDVPSGADSFTADLGAMGYDLQPWSWLGVQLFEPDGDRVDSQVRAVPLGFDMEPATGLVDGQTITLRGSAFTPGEASIVQGYGFIGGLDEATRTSVTVGPEGTFEVSYVVHRALNVPTGPEHDEYVDVDCAGSPWPCFIAAMSGDGRDWAQAETGFRATIGITLDATGTLVRVGGRVTVSGTLTCQAMDSATLTGSLFQRVGRKSLATGTFTVTVPCTKSAWTAVVSPLGTVPFGTGQAELTATGRILAQAQVLAQTDDLSRVITVRAPKR